MKVIGIAFADGELELITGGADGVFLVWQMPSLVLKQRFTRAKNSPLVSANRRRVNIAGFRFKARCRVHAHCTNFGSNVEASSVENGLWIGTIQRRPFLGDNTGGSYDIEFHTN